MPNKKFKKYLPDLKRFGNIVCFEGKVPKSKDMIGEKSFQVYLLNDVNDFSEICERLLLIEDITLGLKVLYYMSCVSGVCRNRF